MGVRNSKELGQNLFIIAKRLLDNERLCQLLVNEDKNPFAHSLDEKKKNKILEDNIKVVPLIDEKEFSSASKLVLLYPAGAVNSNDEFKSVNLDVLVYTPLNNWIINDENLRPFLIMSEVENSLKNKRMNGVGVLKYVSFNLQTITSRLACYRMEFTIDVFN